MVWRVIQDSFIVLLEFARSSHSHCVLEFVDNGERIQNISDITTADSEGKGGVGRLYALVGGEEAVVQLHSSFITSTFSLKTL